MLAVINAIGIPLNLFGTSLLSIFSLIEEKIYNTNKNPTPDAKDTISAFINVYEATIDAIPSTAQFVVISGR